LPRRREIGAACGARAEPADHLYLAREVAQRKGVGLEGEAQTYDADTKLPHTCSFAFSERHRGGAKMIAIPLPLCRAQVPTAPSDSVSKRATDNAPQPLQS
jgi:hypothetical protein